GGEATGALFLVAGFGEHDLAVGAAITTLADRSAARLDRARMAAAANLFALGFRRRFGIRELAGRGLLGLALDLFLFALARFFFGLAALGFLVLARQAAGFLLAAVRVFFRLAADVLVEAARAVNRAGAGRLLVFGE